ncbi:FAD-dependent oxidoreductase [Paracoccus jeotgali]|uniref:3-ketosteroid dehydrogenase n=1 Tax=Paracoccus jeotgali TaxID=2065379 RepID=A0A2K9MG69_9RHOB|nr:FAD-dependent oxidoreductase [Paracoccus jeotgali]AUM74613.1 3-ketosteroid dehydrogenase [Paracoccus jeotgali]
MAILPAEGTSFEVTIPVVVIGGGATGLTAALAAHDAGAEVIVLERDAVPTGSTSLSSGLIPAVGSRQQRAAGIDDSPELFAADISRKTGGTAPHEMALQVARASGPLVDWLADSHGVALDLVTSFLYPGHSALRMHGPEGLTGAHLQQMLLAAVARADIDVVTGASVQDLYADAEGRVHGVRFRRPDGALETLGCKAVVLASCGFAGDPEMVRCHIPEIADAACCGHLSNTGDAVKWGVALGAAVADMDSYQGHGSVAHPHSIPLTWAVITQGGVLLNSAGKRFSNEMLGYSEHGARVAAQPGGTVWDVFDSRAEAVGMAFHDFREVGKLGAIKQADTIAELAAVTGMPADAVVAEFDLIAEAAASGKPDRFGRRFSPAEVLQPPYRAVRVSGALFHTQGGLVIDTQARVQRPDGSALPNLFAGGGAARGLSGTGSGGYLAGNGLLPATVFGRWAGEGAARIAADTASEAGAS